ncbi:MAG: thymidylate kinase [Candidatus Aenigmarchaeota archaeon]|nr:thymidylate kinase [Candidatus Aenigmarchaeota archaeon]
MGARFIVFEGLDSAGKKTQIKLFLERLKKPVELLDFPAYSTRFGAVVGAYLRGEFGKKEEVGAELSALLYSLDRYQFKERMWDAIAQGKILVSNRFTHSNLFQAAKLPEGEWIKFLEWIEMIDSRMPKPDVVVFLDMPPEVGQKLGHKTEGKEGGLEGRDYLKGKQFDIHEEDREFQAKVRRAYLKAAEKEGWIVVFCAENGTPRKPEDIAADIWKRLEPLL